jgi:predicted permease
VSLPSRLSSFVRNLFAREHVERDLDAELAAYLDELVAEKVRAGRTVEAARREARLELGGAEQVKEQVRTARAGAFVEQLIQDLRFGFRQLRRSPGFTTVVVLTLALGIGTSTAVFSLADALFFRLPGVAHADRLVHVSQTRAGSTENSYPVSYPDYVYFRDHSRSFEHLAAHYSGSPLHLVVDGESSSVKGGVVTRNYFATFGLEPALGRFFRPDEDDVPGRDPVAVIAYGLWESRFGRNPSVLGRTIQLNGVSFTIVGVAPPDFEADRAGQEALSLWIPSAMLKVGYRYCDGFRRDCNIVQLTGLLRPEVTIAQAQQELGGLARQLEAAYPATNKGDGVFVVSARGVTPSRQTESRATLQLLGAAVALLLAIACANVAGLIVGRGLSRRREVAVRLSLGAGRGRLVRQFLTESLLLGLMGGAAGLVVAIWAKDLLVAYYGVTYSGVRLVMNLSLNPLVLAFTIGISVITGLAFGLVPALQSSRVDLISAVKIDSHSGGYRRSRLPDGLVVAQVALSIVLLIGAGLMIRSVRSIHQGPGFNPDPIALLRLRPSLMDYPVEKAWRFQADVNRRLAALPGVEAVSSSGLPPLPGWGPQLSLWLPGQKPADPAQAFQVYQNAVMPRYFKMLGLAVIEGRDFTPKDDRRGPPVVIVNQTLARHFWPNAGATGQVLSVDDVEHRVIGVVRDAQYRARTEGPEPFLYRSYWQQDPADSFNGDAWVHLRVAGDPAGMLPAIRRAIAEVDPDVPVNEDLPLAERVNYHFRHVRAVGTMLVTLGSLAIFLSAVALSTVLASAVRQRRREIAIRLAVGASRSTVSTLVLWHGLTMAGLGAVLGLTGGLGATSVLRTLLFGVSPIDPVTFAGVALVLTIVTMAACYVPARLASRVDPMVILRHE